jgi:V/A-type H+-transporting ATPase subunit F
MMDEKNIYVVGSSEFVLGFRLAGIKNVVEIEEVDVNAYMKVMDEIVGKEDVGLIVVDALDFKKLPSGKRAELESLKRPIILTLSKEMVASESLRKKIIQAIGVDLLK